MAKKYKQTRKDRMDESRGMKRYERSKNKKDNSGFVTGHDPSIGQGDFANMPQECIMKPYPKNRMLKGGRLDDTISNVDAVQVGSDHFVESNLSRQK